MQTVCGWTHGPDNRRGGPEGHLSYANQATMPDGAPDRPVCPNGLTTAPHVRRGIAPVHLDRYAQSDCSRKTIESVDTTSLWQEIPGARSRITGASQRPESARSSQSTSASANRRALTAWRSFYGLRKFAGPASLRPNNLCHNTRSHQKMKTLAATISLCTGIKLTASAPPRPSEQPRAGGAH